MKRNPKAFSGLWVFLKGNISVFCQSKVVSETLCAAIRLLEGNDDS
jgi:hypothetical protein